MAANERMRLFALGVAVLLVGVPLARGAELLKIPLGFAKVVQVPGAGKEGKFTAIIGNPDIADFTYGPQNRFMFVGKAPGTTNTVKTYILAEKPREQMFIRNYYCDPGCAVSPTATIDGQGLPWRPCNRSVGSGKCATVCGPGRKNPTIRGRATL